MVRRTRGESTISGRGVTGTGAGLIGFLENGGGAMHGADGRVDGGSVDCGTSRGIVKCWAGKPTPEKLFEREKVGNQDAPEALASGMDRRKHAC